MSTTHTNPHAPELPYCRNCHFTLAAPRPVHCGHCGQETDLHPPSVREMFTEYLGHYVAFDGPLWRTLAALLFLPGHLTNAYFHGRRRRYVLPLRVYLSASFIFFIGWALLPQGPTQTVEADTSLTAKGIGTVRLDVTPSLSPREAAASAARAAGKKSSAPETLLGCHVDKRPEDCTPGERWLTSIARKAEAISFEQWKSRGRALAPYGMLAMQPLFAALLLAAFAGSGRRYAEHFVFSLHSHSLWFLALLLAAATGLDGPVLLAVFVHGLVAMRRVYGLSKWGALWRGLVLSGFYFVTLAVLILSLMALIAATS